MDLLRSRIVWGILLVLGGVALLLENLNVIRIGGALWGFILAVAGLVFLFEYMRNRMRWWPLIPGITLLAVALTILLDVAFPRIGGILGGMIVLGGIGISFVLVYLVDQSNWWAVIPAGVLLTLALMSVLENLDLGFDTGGFFMLGIGLTFFVLSVLPGPHGSLKWAAIPGGVLVVIGVIILAVTEQAFQAIWPVLLILLGLFIAVRALLPGRK